MKTISESVKKRFWAKVKILDKYSCWEWQASLNDGGYGQLSSQKNKKPFLAHRVSYQIHFGQIPDKKLVCHTCDNRKCVNPFHLFIGTQKDNIRDMITKQKGRGQFLPDHSPTGGGKARSPKFKYFKGRAYDTITCETCQNVFYKRVDLIKKQIHHYCSIKCSAKSRINNENYDLKIHNKYYLWTICAECGKRFLKCKSEFLKYNYCSRQCGTSSGAKRRSHANKKMQLKKSDRL